MGKKIRTSWVIFSVLWVCSNSAYAERNWKKCIENSDEMMPEVFKIKDDAVISKQEWVFAKARRDDSNEQVKNKIEDENYYFTNGKKFFLIPRTDFQEVRTRSTERKIRLVKLKYIDDDQTPAKEYSFCMKETIDRKTNYYWVEKLTRGSTLCKNLKPIKDISNKIDDSAVEEDMQYRLISDLEYLKLKTEKEGATVGKEYREILIENWKKCYVPPTQDSSCDIGGKTINEDCFSNFIRTKLPEVAQEAKDSGATTR